MRTVFLVVGAVLAISLAGCGDDAPVPDAPIPDAAIPDAAPDADPFVVCTEYCACMDDRCAGSFADVPACLDVCLGLDSAAQDCRNYHCSLATPGQEAVHCPHARGESLCD